MSLIVHKFGGTSVANAERIAAVAQLMRARTPERQVIVVSALKGTTDQLIDLAALAAGRSDRLDAEFAGLKARHLAAGRALVQDTPALARLIERLENRFDALRDVLHALSLIEDAPPTAVEVVSGLGEVLSAELLAAHFEALGEPALFLDARDVLRIAHGELGPRVDWPVSQGLLDAWLAGKDWSRIVVTGFIARDLKGRITTLGRNGSDWSASIFGALFAAAEVHIWTDVDGVLSADPRLVPEAQVLGALSYDEAYELAYFGAKVIHPQTMAPAAERRMPVIIRNTFNPAHPGTRISADHSLAPPVKGISTVDDQALVTIEGAGMIGVPGTAERVFGALKQAQISVVMISQGSSEHSICCVVRGWQAEAAVEALTATFRRELDDGAIARIGAERDIAVLAVVGDGMAGQPGTAARLFAALGRAQVNIRAIAQGSSERNISVAIGGRDATRALKAVHGGFYLSAQTIAVALIGPGQVGRALLNQLAEAQTRLKTEANLDLRLVAVANSKQLAHHPRGLGWDEWEAQLARAPATFDLPGLGQLIKDEHIPHALIIDCSASDAVAACYADWLKQGVHVVTPNKRLGAGPWARYAAVKAEVAQGGGRFRYEATVGAGLPVISTLRDLLDTGDRIQSIEGLFSGTLAWLFNRYDGVTSFAALVREARALGYTEPDPRDDLSGMDVARKLVILARELGLPLELSAVEVESLVPAPLAGVSTAEFLERIDEADAVMQARHAEAAARGEVLRYVARLEADGRARVALTALPGSHAFAHLALTDNVVAYRTARYHANPLIVQGPGAGPDVTAAGVFADLLRIAGSLGARL